MKENASQPEIPLIDVFWIHKYPVGYPLARVVGIASAIDQNDGWQEESSNNPSIKNVLADYSLEFNNSKEQPLFGFDATGNAGMLPLLTAAGIDAFDIIFSGKSKWHMYQRFQYYVQQRYIKRAQERDSNTINGRDFNHQLSKLVVKKGTQTSYHQIHHENEDDLDDCPDSIAGLIHLIENPDLPTLSYALVDAYSATSTRTKANNLLEGQYVPSWMKKNELKSWVQQKEDQYR